MQDVNPDLWCQKSWASFRTCRSECRVQAWAQELHTCMPILKSKQTWGLLSHSGKRRTCLRKVHLHRMIIKINVRTSGRKGNGKPEFCRRLARTISPWDLRRARPFSCSSFISALTQDPWRGQQEVCERERERWILSSAMIKVILWDIWAQSVYQPWRVFREQEQRWWKALRDKQRMGGRRWMTNFHISLSHSLPLFPLFLFYLSSLLHPPCGLLPLWLASAGKKSWSLVLAGNPQHAHCLLWLGLVKGALCSRDDTGFLPVFFTPKSNWPFPAVLHLLWRK